MAARVTSGDARRDLQAYLSKLPKPSSSAGSAEPAHAAAGHFWQQLRSVGLVGRCVALLGVHALETALVIASWAAIGAGALSGRVDTALIAAWALCLMSAIPLRVAAHWLEGVLAIGFGGLLKERLLAGAMRIDPEFVRRKGTGDLVGDVIEADEIERLAASGGLDTVLASLQLSTSLVLLVWGTAAGLEISVLAGWLALTVAFIVRNTRARFRWTMRRVDLTQQAVEQMLAHRTRAVQQCPNHWHQDEDRQLSDYGSAAAALDRSTAWLEAALPRGYVVLAVAALLPSFLGGARPAEHAVTFGVILFAAGAFQRLTFGAPRAAAAWIAWRAARPMFEAAAHEPVQGAAAIVAEDTTRVLQAQEVSFTHAGRNAPAVRACSLHIDRGDAVLLEGESGSGKSTFAALLANIRRASSGLVLAGGLDAQTLGDAGWRRHVAAVPQFHENYILSASLGFNLLLGRPYPHSHQDYADATEICHELGLGPLLVRMPAGLDQMVGETGWQLSHGERSRIFLGRALLQRAHLTIVDESLATLDSETQRLSLECLRRRASSLLVVAHP